MKRDRVQIGIAVLLAVTILYLAAHILWFTLRRDPSDVECDTFETNKVICVHGNTGVVSS